MVVTGLPAARGGTRRRDAALWGDDLEIVTWMSRRNPIGTKGNSADCHRAEPSAQKKKFR